MTPKYVLLGKKIVLTEPKLCFCQPRTMLLVSKNYAFAKQKLCSSKAKTVVLPCFFMIFYCLKNTIL